MVKRRWTVMVYMAADTDENLYNAALKDIGELKSAANGGKFSLFVHADAPFHWETKRLEIRNGKATELRPADGAGIPESKSLPDFVRMCREKSGPEDYFLLVLWGHGEGIDWSSRILAQGQAKRFNTGAEDSLSLAQLGDALKALGIPQERLMVGFDSCLMGMLEVYFELRDSVGWVVAANDEIPLTGWPYHQIMPILARHPHISPRILAAKIVDECKKAYSGDSSEGPVSFSACALDTKNCAKVRDAFKRLTKQLKRHLRRESVQDGIRWAREYAEDFKEEAYVDVNAFCAELQRQRDMPRSVKSAAKAVHEALMGLLIKPGIPTNYPPRYKEDSIAVSLCFPKTAELTGSLPGFKVDLEKYRELEFSDTGWPELMQDVLELWLLSMQPAAARRAKQQGKPGKQRTYGPPNRVGAPPKQVGAPP